MAAILPGTPIYGLRGSGLTPEVVGLFQRPTLESATNGIKAGYLLGTADGGETAEFLRLTITADSSLKGSLRWVLKEEVSLSANGPALTAASPGEPDPASIANADGTGGGTIVITKPSSRLPNWVLLREGNRGWLILLIAGIVLTCGGIWWYKSKH